MTFDKSEMFRFEPSLPYRYWPGHAVRLRLRTECYKNTDEPHDLRRRTFAAGTLFVCVAAFPGRGLCGGTVGCVLLDEPGTWYFDRYQVEIGRVVGMDERVREWIRKLCRAVWQGLPGRYGDPPHDRDKIANDAEVWFDFFERGLGSDEDFDHLRGVTDDDLGPGAQACPMLPFAAPKGTEAP